MRLAKSARIIGPMSAPGTLEHPALPLPLGDISVLCKKYGVTELSVFGSVLRDDFRPDSDIDFLAVFENGDLDPWMSKLTDLEDELTELLDRKAEVVDKRSVEASENYIRRKHVLDSARVIYVA